MKTLSTIAQKNNLTKLIAGLTLSIGLLVTGTASAQTTPQQKVSFADNQAFHTQTSDDFKVAVFPMANSLTMKVVLENPNKEKVTVLIKNAENEVVYRKMVGKDPIIHGKFDVSGLVNGSYTMIIESVHQSHSSPFSVKTHQERLAKAY
ncbi:hypothetical protein Q0590_37255 [Rhodocytophaga aerolata]|uniref:Secretion system C-terminal sorting domain-containing protein n=1 Tax=Rhodocytophaga aerolata TaxID=455078 RepID=A0ABT8RLH5_9BACT|nr:hypothetical protein [Rhodocytophaga aerolata]MDO1451977.1 hypothetical protein [Rhodocytophaga aerolata]